MLKFADDAGGHQRERLVVGLGLQKGDNGKLASVERTLAHHRLEAVVCGFGSAEVELDDG